MRGWVTFGEFPAWRIGVRVTGALLLRRHAGFTPSSCGRRRGSLGRTFSFFITEY